MVCVPEEESLIERPINGPAIRFDLQDSLATLMAQSKRANAGADDDTVMNSRETAKLLGISERTLYKMYTEGSMPKPLRLGNIVRFGKKEILAWIAEGCPSAIDWKWPK